MSKIVTPYPPYEGEIKASPNACWWRFETVPDVNGHMLRLRSNPRDGDYTTATWVSYEFFDGHSTIIDTGFDKPTKVRIKAGIGCAPALIDVLHDGPPSPSPAWQQLTKHGDHVHPEE